MALWPADPALAPGIPRCPPRRSLAVARTRLRRPCRSHRRG